MIIRTHQIITSDKKKKKKKTHKKKTCLQVKYAER